MLVSWFLLVHMCLTYEYIYMSSPAINKGYYYYYYYYYDNNGSYPAEGNSPGLYAALVSATIIPRLYFGK